MQDMLREGQRQGICLAKANKKIKGGDDNAVRGGNEKTE